MTGELRLRNCQRACSLDLRLFRQITLFLLRDLAHVQNFELGVHLVDTPAITKLNEELLHHRGATDVITFNYRARRGQTSVQGDVFVCVSEAILQAPRFRTTWQTELIRYVAHGILHLQGHDDLKAADRRKMKLVENRLVATLARQFPLHRIEKGSRTALGRS